MYEFTLVNSVGETAEMECVTDCSVMKHFGMCKTTNPLYAHEEFDEFIQRWEVELSGQKSLLGINDMQALECAAAAAGLMFRLAPEAFGTDVDKINQAILASQEFHMLDLERFEGISGIVTDFLRDTLARVHAEIFMADTQDQLSLISFGKFLVKLYELAGSPRSDESRSSFRIKVISVPDEIAEVAEMQHESNRGKGMDAEQLFRSMIKRH